MGLIRDSAPMHIKSLREVLQGNVVAIKLLFDGLFFGLSFRFFANMRVEPTMLQI